MAITRRGTEILKLAADAQPTASTVQVGTVLRNTDDSKVWRNSGSDWILEDFVEYKKFNVHKEGSNYYVTDINHRVVQGPSTDVSDLVMDQMALQGLTALWEFEWDATLFTIENPIVIPPTSTGVKKFVHKGPAPMGKMLDITTTSCLKPSATFPTNRYIFELNNAGSGSTSTGYAHIEGFQALNDDYFPTKNVGFVKFEAGEQSNGNENWIVANCHTQYLWRNLHLIGKVWHGRFENLSFAADNASFSGDADIILEDGGHIGANNTTPKENKFYNIRNMHSNGQQVDSIRIKSGGYNIFSDIFIDGFKCSNAIISLNNTDGYSIHDNVFQNVTSIDMTTPSPDNRQAALYLAGTSCHDNVFKVMRLPAYLETLKIAGAGAMGNDIEIAAHWGATSRVTDTGADASNIIRVFPGNRITGSDAAIIQTGAVSKVIDPRRGAFAAGSQNITGNGSTLQFDFAHGMFGTPAYAVVVPGSASIITNPFWVTWTALNLRVTFNTAPPAGTHTLRYITGVYK